MQPSASEAAHIRCVYVWDLRTDFQISGYRQSQSPHLLHILSLYLAVLVNFCRQIEFLAKFLSTISTFLLISVEFFVDGLDKFEFVLWIWPNSVLTWMEERGQGEMVSIYIVIFVTFIMSSVTLATSGSIHQGDERFSENSRGRRCAFNPFISLTALLYDQRRISNFEYSRRNFIPGRQIVCHCPYKSNYFECRIVSWHASYCSFLGDCCV